MFGSSTVKGFVFNRLILLIIFFGNPGMGFCQTADWKVFTTFNSGISDNMVFSVAFQEDGVKWIGTGNGLTRFDDSNWTTFRMDNSGLPANTISCLMADPGGKLWIGTDGRMMATGGGVVIFDGYFWDAFTPSNSPIPDKWITSIARDQEGNKWIGTGHGLVKFDGANWILLPPGSQTYYSTVTSLAIEKDSVVLVGTEWGLSRLDYIGWTIFRTENSGLPDDNIRAVTVDSTGVYWIGTSGGGLAKFEDPAWTVFDTSNSGLPDNEVTAIATAGDSAIWIGTRTRGLVRLANASWTIYDTANSPIPSNNINSVSIDKWGNKWIGTSAGLAVYKGGGIQGIIPGKPTYPGKKEIVLENIYPNPVQHETTLTFRLEEPENISIRIFNMFGETVLAIMESKVIQAGTHTMRIDFTLLSAGIYFCLIKTEGNLSTGKLIIEK